MNAEPDVDALLSRARLLRDHGRFAEAERLLGDALRLDPENAGVFAEIALCRGHAGNREAEALEAIDRAIALAPECAAFQAIRALILHDMRRYRDALAAADAAIALDPEETTAFLARAHALTGLEQRAAAEQAVRRALELDPDSDPAHNLLSMLLRLQNRRAENAAQLRAMLERNPENADTHANAGWAALHEGNRTAAQQHFLEALRLEPANEMARTGLLEAFKSRSWVYRGYLRYCLFMQRFTHSQRWVIMIGALLAYNFLRGLARLVGPGWAAAVIVTYALLVFWSHLARSVGNTLVLLDRVARHALRFQERLDGLVGAMVVTGIVAGIAALGLHSWATGLGAVGLLAMSVPLSKALLNDSRPGRFVFGGLALLVLAAAILYGVAMVVPGLRGASQSLNVLAVVGVVLSTFLGAVPALRG